MLLLTAFIWGTAFVAQSKGMDSVQAFTFNGLRCIVGSIVLMPVVFLNISRRKKNGEPNKAVIRATHKAAIPISLMFFFATNIQQEAFNFSTSGKIAFITSLYMFFVPLIGLFFGKRISKVTWICIVAAFVGLYFLCFPSGEGFDALNIGDVMALLCAIGFAGHMLLVERCSAKIDGVLLSSMQFAICGVASSIVMLLFEEPKWSAITEAGIPILYAGVLSCGLGYTFQILGQKYCEATIASLLMCLECVFAAIAGAVILRQYLNVREIAGCAIMFAAIVISQFAEARIGQKQ